MVALQPGVHSRRISGTATVPEPRRRQRPRETANKSGNLAWRHCPRLLPSCELVRVPKTMDKHNACPWTFRSIDQTLYHAEPNLVIFSCMYLCTSQAYHIAQNKNPHAHHSTWMLMHPMCSGCRARASDHATSLAIRCRGRDGNGITSTSFFRRDVWIRCNAL